jgi:CubicO group peptidase (beta-lactamase class C family)
MFTRLFLFVFLIIVNVACIQNMEEAVPAESGLSEVDNQVSRFMRKWSLQGGSVALAKDGRLVYVRGFGNADQEQATESTSLFRIASLSKPITAIAILKLVEAGKLNLEDTVFGEHGILNTPEYATIADDRVRQITVRQLLQHTAGWDRDRSPEGDPMFNSVAISQTMAAPTPASVTTIIQYILTKPLDFSPGSRYAYSNVGYAILGRVIEKVTGKGYESYVKESVLYPSGAFDMQLGHNLYSQKQVKEVRYYEKAGAALVPSVCEIGKQVNCPYGGFNLEAMDAHGGWLASSMDLARVLVGTSGIAAKPGLLPEDLIRTMLTPSDQNSNYALGWFVNQAGNYWHTGSLVGSSTMMAHLKSGVSWVILFNGNPQTQEYFRDLDQLMWKALDKVQTWPEQDLFITPLQEKRPSMQ